MASLFLYSPGSKITFPLDDGKHASDKTVTEWWYLNLHLIGSAPEYRKYDVMLFYFGKPINMRIFTIRKPGTVRVYPPSKNKTYIEVPDFKTHL